jgi:hypothetical protein
MFHYGKELNMSKTHLLDVRYKVRSHFPVGEEPIPFFGNPSPRPKMNFVDRVGSVQPVRPVAVLHPIAISPFIIHFPYYGACTWRGFPVKGIRISLVHPIVVVPGNDVILIDRSLG